MPSQLSFDSINANASSDIATDNAIPTPEPINIPNAIPPEKIFIYYNLGDGNRPADSALIRISDNNAIINLDYRPIREGHQFLGWSFSPNAATLDIPVPNSSGSNGYILPLVPDANGQVSLTIYAVWAKNSGREDESLLLDPFLKKISEQQMLPNTGFSSRRFTPIKEKPAELIYAATGIELELPSINAHAPIVEVPQDKNGWAADWLGANAGLMSGSSYPGEGPCFIAAHNHLNTLESGPFLLISKMEKNDRVFILRNNQLLQYAVYANELYLPEEMNVVYNKAVAEGSPLVLITCEQEDQDGGYLYRRVVFARQTSPENANKTIFE